MVRCRICAIVGRHATVSILTVQDLFYARPGAAPTQLRLQPCLASGNALDHPDQMQLRAAQEDAGELLAPFLGPLDVPLTMRLDVGLPTLYSASMTSTTTPTR